MNGDRIEMSQRERDRLKVLSLVHDTHATDRCGTSGHAVAVSERTNVNVSMTVTPAPGWPN